MESTATGEAHGEADTESHSRTEGGSLSETESEGVSEVPFHRMEEFDEPTFTFWSLEELRYMQAAAIKNQDIAETFVKIDNRAPVRVKVKHVSSTLYHERTSEKRLARFREAVYLANPEIYTPALEARQEYEERQKLVFGRALQFDQQAALPAGEDDVIDVEVVEDEEKSPFNE